MTPGTTGFLLAACTAGQVTSGSITIGNITTPVVRPVNVQFGFWTPPYAAAGGDNTGHRDHVATPAGSCRRPRACPRCWSPSRT